MNWTDWLDSGLNFGLLFKEVAKKLQAADLFKEFDNVASCQGFIWDFQFCMKRSLPYNRVNKRMCLSGILVRPYALISMICAYLTSPAHFI